MLETGSESLGRQNHLDYDVHGLVGIRLVDPSPTDAAAVARQLGPLESPLSRNALPMIPALVTRSANPPAVTTGPLSSMSSMARATEAPSSSDTTARGRTMRGRKEIRREPFQGRVGDSG